MPRTYVGAPHNCIQVVINGAVIGYFSEPSVAEQVVSILKEELEEADIPLESIVLNPWFIEGEF